MSSVLVTGGAGYIGSHTCVELINNGYEVIVFDNLSNSSQRSLNRVKAITKKDITFFEGDITHQDDLNHVFSKYKISYVIHFAGLKAVSESVEDPLTYYDNNVSGTLCLLKTMKKYNVKKLVFSSSATVYGEPESLPLTEVMPSGIIKNPYGRSKLIIENMLNDLCSSDPNWSIIALRYFNPVGAHPSGLIGENPKGKPNNIMPLISQVATGNRDFLEVMGSDYETHDGTGVRDYIHVVDLSCGHIKALKKIREINTFSIVNLGTGHGYSVLDLVREFERASGKKIPIKIVDRRKGDIAACYADCTFANSYLNWKACHGLAEMCLDTWRWLEANPMGFDEA